MKVSLIVGHNPVQQGAISKLGWSEFGYNSLVAYQMIENNKNKNMDLKVFFRDYKGSYTKEIKEVYRQVNEWGADISLELHFNSCDIAEASGYEVLSSGSEKSLMLGRCILSHLGSYYNSKDRGLKMLKRGDRGFLSLVSGKAPAVIVEPFFGSNPDDCVMFEDVNKLAIVYLESIYSYFEV